MANERKTSIDLPELNELKAPDSGHIWRFQLITSKYNGHLQTLATVDQHDAEAGFTRFVLFQDFNKVVLKQKKRATQKAIDAQHELALEQVEGFKALALDHYRK